MIEDVKRNGNHTFKKKRRHGRQSRRHRSRGSPSSADSVESIYTYYSSHRKNDSTSYHSSQNCGERTESTRHLPTEVDIPFNFDLEGPSTVPTKILYKKSDNNTLRF